MSISMDTAFGVETLEQAFASYGQPEIFTTDQGSKFTSEAFTDALKAGGVAISMGGKGGWRDNVFVERLWRSIQYEAVYLHAYDPVSQAKAGIARRIDFYNITRPHASLDKKKPERVLLRVAAGDQTGSLGGEHEFPTAGVGRYAASADRPPAWTTLHRRQTRRASLIETTSILGQAEPPLHQTATGALIAGWWA